MNNYEEKVETKSQINKALWIHDGNSDKLKKLCSSLLLLLQRTLTRNAANIENQWDKSEIQSKVDIMF